MDDVPRKLPSWTRRRNKPKGIFWRGWLYESIPQLAHKKYVDIIEDNISYLLVSDYEWDNASRGIKLIGPVYRVYKISTGMPTNERINNLKRRLVK